MQARVEPDRERRRLLVQVPPSHHAVYYSIVYAPEPATLFLNNRAITVVIVYARYILLTSGNAQRLFINWTQMQSWHMASVPCLAPKLLHTVAYWSEVCCELLHCCR